MIPLLPKLVEVVVDMLVSETVGDEKPPHVRTKDERHRAARLKLVACSAFLGVVALSFVTAASFGAFPEVFSGFVKTSEARSHWLTDTRTDLIRMTTTQCVTKSAAEKQLLETAIEWRKQEFRELAGYDWTAPDCQRIKGEP